MELRKLTWLLLTLCSLNKASGADLQHPEFLAQLSKAPTGNSWTDPSGSNTLYAWWVASDLTGTGNLVNNTNPWIDRVQGIKLQNSNLTGSTGNGPTNGASGLDFLGGRALTNAPLAAGTNSTICIIIKPHTLASGFQRYVYGPYDDSDATQGGVTPGCIVIHNASTSFHWGGFGAAGGGDISGVIVTDTLYDLIVNQSNVTFYALTNGVGSSTKNVHPPAGGWPWQYLGWDRISSADLFDGIVKEVLVWSNSFSATQVTNVHHYATNTYSFSP